MNIRRWAEYAALVGCALLIFILLKVAFAIAVIGAWSICCA